MTPTTCFAGVCAPDFWLPTAALMVILLITAWLLLYHFLREWFADYRRKAHYKRIRAEKVRHRHRPGSRAY